MKREKFLLVCLLSSFSASLQAQTIQLEYRPFVEEGKSWSVQKGFDFDNCSEFFVKSDTLIDETKWKVTTCAEGEVVCDDYFAALREEDKKVYAIKAGTNTPRLIYDFDLKIGDVIQLLCSKSSSFRWISNPGIGSQDNADDYSVEGTMELTGIDVAKTLGVGWKEKKDVPFRRFTFKVSWADSSKESNTVVWIEGVGSDGGPFMPWHYSNEHVKKGEGDNYFGVMCLQNKNYIFCNEDFYAAGESLGINTGITSYTLPSDLNAYQPLFDLQGRRVTGQPRRGVYIQNGRKRMVKD